MTSSTSPNSIEDQLHAATRVPQPRPEFLAGLRARLADEAELYREAALPVSFGARIKLAFRRPAWVTVMVVLFLLAAGLLAVGPQRVLAAFRQVLGYIPGVGIVEQGTPIRVLAEPVSLTRDGITITVTSVILTGDRTHVDYRIFGVPGSAYPDREDVIGCTQREYLRLPDGTQLTYVDNKLPPIPAGVDEAVFVLPCIFNTLPGKTPENWELPLRFVPAPPDLTVMPVIDLSPSPQATQGATALPNQVSSSPTAPASRSATVIKEIETSDGYILVGQFQPPIQPGEDVQLTGSADIRDANGKKVTYTLPQDVGPNALGLDPNGSYWYVQFKAAGLAYPLSITFSGVALRQADSNATAEFTFDAGPNPQPGQEWTPNQDIQLAGRSGERFGRAALRQVGGLPLHFGAGLGLNLRRRRRQRLRVARGDHDRAAFLRQYLRAGPADAFRAAGDQRADSGEIGRRLGHVVDVTVVVMGSQQDGAPEAGHDPMRQFAELAGDVRWQLALTGPGRVQAVARAGWGRRGGLAARGPAGNTASARPRPAPRMATMPIARDDVAHLARLSRLALADDELDHLAAQLDVIIAAVARVQEVAADGIPPTSHAVPLVNVLREDVVEPCLGADKALDQAPAVEQQRFRVPRILAED